MQTGTREYWILGATQRVFAPVGFVGHLTRQTTPPLRSKRPKFVHFGSILRSQIGPRGDALHVFLLSEG